MKIVAELKKRKIPIVRIDKSLNKYDDIVLFPDKLEKANKILGKTGLPEQRTDAAKDGNSEAGISSI
jgi:hypothetical protein